MSNPYLSPVNQRLQYARSQLELLAAVSPRNKAQTQSCLVAAVVHLVDAFTLYLREVAYNYRIKASAAVDDVNALVTALQAGGSAPAEAWELHQLAQEPQSWLFVLLRLYAHRLDVAEAVTAQPAANPQAIPVVNLGSEALPLTLESCSAESLAELANEMQQLVERQRESMIEY